MKLNLKIFIGLVLVFGLLFMGMALWEPVHLKYYKWKLASDNPADKVAAVEWFINKGDKGIERFKELFADGPEAAELLITAWRDDNHMVEDGHEVFTLLGLDVEDLNYADSSTIDVTYLHIAAYNGYVDTVKMLLFKGYDLEGELKITQTWVNAQGIHAKRLLLGSSLHCAALKGQNKVAAYLLSKGIDVNITTEEGFSPLHWASYNGYLGTAKLLISKGASVNARSDFGETPLHWAARSGHNKILNLLISNGADVNAKNGYNETPLYWASSRGRSETVELLISQGADVNVKDTNGQTALYYAIIGNHSGTVALLRKHGARTGDELETEEGGKK